jgi:glycine cleavage system transcriptional repressor
MTTNMANATKVSISVKDRPGLVAAVAGRLFDLGANLGDTSFAVIVEGSEFTTVCDLPDDVRPETVATELMGLAELADAAIEVTPFDLDPRSGPTGHVTHRIIVDGGDRPGLIARLCEVFVQFGANIVRLNSPRLPSSREVQYVIDMAISIDPTRADTCLATVANTAGEVGLACRWEAV